MIGDDARRILQAVDDLNRHGIYPSFAETLRRAFGQHIGDLYTRGSRRRLMSDLIITRQLEAKGYGLRLTDAGREAIRITA